LKFNQTKAESNDVVFHPTTVPNGSVVLIAAWRAIALTKAEGLGSMNRLITPAVTRELEQLLNLGAPEISR
jgi:hypothetical protein